MAADSINSWLMMAGTESFRVKLDRKLFLSNDNL
ncbi:hypothetical protein SAMN04515674_107147 [Pseudarcicella hirudinis]|uniref:Uncharacterized protein n=1 Tax=Pseudarcicella hirudinis TaxID=1079859 RepID=A0A1I5UF27_9BACT|nr:hypothetical protein SAMN04515674_107147 [Pseudarcicella hirudinis]